MAGHNKWAQIKRQKGIVDEKRGKLFSKLVRAIAAAAKGGSDPKLNPRLKAAIAKAKEANVPQENIGRAVTRVLENDEGAEKLLCGAYGPGGSAILLEAITDSRNRTVAEIKKLLSDFDGKWAEAGSVEWAFEKTPDGWRAKFLQGISEEGKERLRMLFERLKEHADVEWVVTNVQW